MATIAILLSLSTVCLVFLIRYIPWPGPTRKKSSTRLARKVGDRSQLAGSLAEALPYRTFFETDDDFDNNLTSFWAAQQREIVPECIVRPQNAAEVAVAMKVIQSRYSLNGQPGSTEVRFAIKSGGHSPVLGAANSQNGIVIDLSRMDRVVLADDAKSVDIGPGARWRTVYSLLGKHDLAVAGGRNASVGVGGLVLGGGLSYFSPQVGFVCNNVLELEVVLADGTIVSASESVNPDLFKALKGGSNNFGVVTNVKMKTFPCDKIWAGWIYTFSWKASALIQAQHSFLKQDSQDYDSSAAGPLVCFVYVQALSMKFIATNLVYTKPLEWPSCFAAFKKIGRIWSTAKLRTLENATEELDGLNPAGSRQLFTTTTILNDLDTMNYAHQLFLKSTEAFAKVKGGSWTMIFQPIHPIATDNSNSDCLGLELETKSLVNILLNGVWQSSKYDTAVSQIGRSLINEINEYATSKRTAHRYRYINNCSSNQQPFDGYGDENKEFLIKISKKFDPDLLMQRACSGGFKLVQDNVVFEDKQRHTGI